MIRSRVAQHSDIGTRSGVAEAYGSGPDYSRPQSQDLHLASVAPVREVLVGDGAGWAAALYLVLLGEPGDPLPHVHLLHPAPDPLPVARDSQPGPVTDDLEGCRDSGAGGAGVDELHDGKLQLWLVVLPERGTTVKEP